mgnify:CR=1 FL=1
MEYRFKIDEGICLSHGIRTNLCNGIHRLEVACPKLLFVDNDLVGTEEADLLSLASIAVEAEKGCTLVEMEKLSRDLDGLHGHGAPSLHVHLHQRFSPASSHSIVVALELSQRQIFRRNTER